MSARANVSPPRRPALKVRKLGLDDTLVIELTRRALAGAGSYVNKHPIRAGDPLILSNDDPALLFCSLDGEFAHREAVRF